MAAVKFVHVLKRIEFLDNCIRELKELMATLNPHRPYYDGIKIAIEAQINQLLNERIKLMELKIENPLPHLVEEPLTHQKQLKESPMYDLQELLLKQDFSAKTETKSFVPVKEMFTPPTPSAPAKKTSLKANLLRDFPETQY